MKYYICPQCKEVIHPEQLCGNNKECMACSFRINNRDLIEFDTEDIINHQKLKKQNTSSSPSTLSSNVLLDSCRNMVSYLTHNNSDFDQDNIPVIHSLAELQLPPKVKMDPGYGIPTFIYAPKAKDMIFFSVFWNIFIFTIATVFLKAMLSDPASIRVNGHAGTKDDWWILLFFVPFILVGIGTAYTAIHQYFKKTWIEVGYDELRIESGFSRKNIYKSFPKDPNKTLIINEVGYRSNGSPRYYIKIQSEQDEIKLASGLTVTEAKAMERFLLTILNANL